MSKVQPYITDNGEIRVKPVADDALPFPDPSWITFLRRRIPVVHLDRDLVEITFKADGPERPRSKQHYEYKLVNISMERNLPPYPEIDDVANKYAAEGWRMVAFVPVKDNGYSECLMLERVKIDG